MVVTKMKFDNIFFKCCCIKNTINKKDNIIENRSESFDATCPKQLSVHSNTSVKSNNYYFESFLSFTRNPFKDNAV